MRRWLLIGALALASCGGGEAADKASTQTVSEYCVEKVEAFYKRNDLPFTSDPAERPAICAKWMQDNSLTTKADIATKIQELDKYYRDLKK